MIPIGWSVGDIIAGITVVWNVYNSVSDGPLNATAEARQFFQEFSSIVGCLEDWEKRKDASKRNSNLAKAHQQLKDECTAFVKKHMRLIQTANPSTRAVREGRSTWLRKAQFTGQQLQSLYEHVEWPLERKEVSRLKEKLLMFLQVATYDVTAASHHLAIDTNDIVRHIHDMQTRNSELVSSNHKLVISHLELVSLITFNLKRVTHPLESGSQMHEIDYPMLKQFEQALLPPQPLRAIEAGPRLNQPPWRSNNNENGEASSRTPFDLDSRAFGQSDSDSDMMSRRLDNLSMRRIPRRVETIDTITSENSSVSREDIAFSVSPLIQRLRTMRNELGYAVGIQRFPTLDPAQFHSPAYPQNTLEQEINAWNLLGERIEREILHPGHLLTESSSNQDPTTRFLAGYGTSSQELTRQNSTRIDSSATSVPIPIRISSRASVSHSPMSTSPPRASLSTLGSVYGSPERERGYGYASSSSPTQQSRTPRHIRSPSSTTSPSPPASILLSHQISVGINYGIETIKCFIYSTTRSEDGEIESITSWSQDGLKEFRHTVIKTPNLFPSESSMKPFLDNTHIDTNHRFRVQFQGSHNLKITNGSTVKRYKNVAMIYQFFNEKDFITFQEHLLHSKILLLKNIHHIKSLPKREIQTRESTLHLLSDPFASQKSILYFRTHRDKDSSQKQGFVQWPVSLFKEPKEPKKRKTLELESCDGRSLSFSRARDGDGDARRRNTMGSVSISTIGSMESSIGGNGISWTHSSGGAGKSIKGLIIEFYDPNDCHEFWKAFREKDFVFSGDEGLELGMIMSTSMGIDGNTEVSELEGNALSELAA